MEEEKIKKRQEKYGIIASSTSGKATTTPTGVSSTSKSTTVIPSIPSINIDEEKINKRKAKYGEVEVSGPIRKKSAKEVVSPTTAPTAEKAVPAVATKHVLVKAKDAGKIVVKVEDEKAALRLARFGGVTTPVVAAAVAKEKTKTSSSIKNGGIVVSVDEEAIKKRAEKFK